MKESALLKCFDKDGKLVSLIRVDNNADKPSLDSFEEEVWRIFFEYQKLKSQYKNYERLWEIVDMDECDGDCDDPPDYERCPSCTAGSLINELGEILGYGLRDIEQAIEKSKKS